AMRCQNRRIAPNQILQLPPAQAPRLTAYDIHAIDGIDTSFEIGLLAYMLLEQIIDPHFAPPTLLLEGGDPFSRNHNHEAASSPSSFSFRAHRSRTSLRTTFPTGFLGNAANKCKRFGVRTAPIASRTKARNVASSAPSAATAASRRSPHTSSATPNAQASRTAG